MFLLKQKLYSMDLISEHADQACSRIEDLLDLVKGRSQTVDPAKRLAGTAAKRHRGDKDSGLTAQEQDDATVAESKAVRDGDQVVWAGGSAQLFELPDERKRHLELEKQQAKQAGVINRRRNSVRSGLSALSSSSDESDYEAEDPRRSRKGASTLTRLFQF